MKKNLIAAVLMTLVTTILLGIIYPLVVTVLAQLFFKDKANGQLVLRNDTVIGSRILAQPFSGPQYFHPRPSAAGANGYDPTNSAGTQYGPTNQKLIERVRRDVEAAHKESPGTSVPVDLVTTSGSGLDPHITPAGANFQLRRVARERGISEGELRGLVKKHLEGRQLGLLGEPRINVLELNLDLDSTYPLRK